MSLAPALAFLYDSITTQLSIHKALLPLSHHLALAAAPRPLLLQLNSAVVSCTIAWDLYSRFLAAAISPLACMVVLAFIPCYQRWCAGRCSRVTVITSSSRANRHSPTPGRTRGRRATVTRRQLELATEGGRLAQKRRKASWSTYRTSVLVVWYLIYPTGTGEAGGGEHW